MPDPNARMRHNRAMTPIANTWKEIDANNLDCNEMLCQLLSQENPRVVLLAANPYYRINRHKPFNSEALQLAHNATLRIYNDKNMNLEDHSMAVDTKMESIDPKHPDTQ